MKIESKYKCVFCDKLKNNSNRYFWRSDLHIVLGTNYPYMIKLTVCPNCRNNHTIQEFYDKSLFVAQAYFKKTLNQIIKKD